MTVNTTHLCAKVREAKPDLPLGAVVKAIMKLQKLASTISKRETLARNGGIDDPIGYTHHTQYFYRKAYDIARGIGCEFVAAPGTAQYWVRINNQAERIV